MIARREVGAIAVMAVLWCICIVISIGIGIARLFRKKDRVFDWEPWRDER